MSRHVWRCKARFSQQVNTPIVNQPAERYATTSITNDITIDTPELSLANIDNSIPCSDYPPEIRDNDLQNRNRDKSKDNNNENDDDDGNDINHLKCYCGKKCKRLRGLQAHERACKVLTIPDLKTLYETPPQ